MRGILFGFLCRLPIDAIMEHRSVIAAEWCYYKAGHGRRLPTRQVVRVTLRGPLPAPLDLGCWGRFSVREYISEPICCFQCKSFGHHQMLCPPRWSTDCNGGIVAVLLTAAELIDLLQQQAVAEIKVSHEPALVFVRRLLSNGGSIPA